MSETAKHTPGPWSLPHFAEPDCNCECGYVLTDGMMGAVATVHCSGEGDDWLSHGDNPKFAEAVANARLIAAAPDYDAAARKMVEALGVAPDEVIEGAFGANLFDALKDLRAAIAKAEGRS